MDSSHAVIIISSIVVLVSSHLSTSYAHEWIELKTCKFDAIYNFGSSMSDTGNALFLNHNALENNHPYGRSIKNTKGRYSDGFLTVDYIAQAAGLPHLKPYLNFSNINDHHQGINFAVGGGTALRSEVLRGLSFIPFINISLDIQLQWWDKYSKRLCHDPKDCKEKLKSSLFIIGAIGSNDYYAAFFNHGTFKKMKHIHYVSKVVKAIEEGVRKIISYGAAQVLVPGYIPIGCTPTFLTVFSDHFHERDEFGCLKDYNDFIKHHNDVLHEAVLKLRKEYPNVRIVYGDYYDAMEWIMQNHKKFGFKTISTACCGIGGKYNFDSLLRCGDVGVPSCSKPKNHIFWDGLHLTQEANKRIAIWFIQNILPQFECMDDR